MSEPDAPLSEVARAHLQPLATPLPEPEPGVIRVAPSKGWASLRLGEVWAYRELMFFLAWRDVKVRYKQTVLGAGWAILQPFLTMVVFTIFFGNLARIPSEGVPYPVFSYAALVPWTFFANGVSNSSNGLVGNANLITKVYFPRLVIPVAQVIAGLVDFVLAFLVLIGMMLFYGIRPTAQILALPLFLALALAAALGVGFWLSALNVEFRDVRYVVPFLTQLWLFITPVVYPSHLLHQPWQTLYALNPMVAVTEGFRWSLLGTQTDLMPMVLISSLSALAILLGGALYFRRMERTFADVV
jgi:lipopolysaccharide transport system permease protein